MTFWLFEKFCVCSSLVLTFIDMEWGMTPSDGMAHFLLPGQSYGISSILKYK